MTILPLKLPGVPPRNEGVAFLQYSPVRDSTKQPPANIPTMLNVGARLDRLPPSAFHTRVLLLVGLGMFLDGCDVYLAPAVLASITASKWGSLTQNAIFLSTTFGGMLVGALLGGFLGDKYGRRFSYQVNLLLFGIASIAAAFAPNMNVLIIVRFIMGIGLGGEVVFGYSSIVEFMPAKYRGRYAAGLSAIANVAVVAIGFAGWWVIPRFGWRWLFGAIGAGAVVAWRLRRRFPESPRWLEGRGRREEAERTIGIIEAEVAQKHALPSPSLEAPLADSSGALSDLFRTRLWRSLLVASALSVVSGLTAFGFLSWIPTFLVKGGMGLAKSLWFTALMGLGAPLGGLLAACVADRFSRPALLCGLALASAVLGGLYPFAGSGTEAVLVGFALTICTYSTTALGVALYIPELFPTRLRLRGAALSNGAGRLCAIGVPFLILALYKAFGIIGVAMLLVCSLFLLAIILFFLGPETNAVQLETIGHDEFS